MSNYWDYTDDLDWPKCRIEVFPCRHLWDYRVIPVDSITPLMSPKWPVRHREQAEIYARKRAREEGFRVVGLKVTRHPLDRRGR